MISYDISATETLITENGDFLPVESDGQHIEAIIQASKANFVTTPLLGVGIQKYINAPTSSRELRKVITTELTRDNYQIDTIEVVGTIDNIGLNVNANKVK